MSIDALRETLDSAAELVLEEAVPVIATALVGHDLHLPVQSYDETTGGMQLLTSKDVDGGVWLYAYTGEDMMVGGGLTGSKSTTMDFLDIVRMTRENKFAGIAIDIAQDTNRGMIPDYWFDEILRVLAGEPQSD